MNAEILWTETGLVEGGVEERAFTVQRHDEAISCVFWRPESQNDSAPLVLMGHGGGGHKRNERMVMLGRLFAGAYGWNAVAMDGLAHGDRGPVTNATDPAYREMWARENPVQDMIDDWGAVLDAASTQDWVDVDRVGYWGVSMGTMFGLPFVASESRVKVAVLGKAGLTGASVDRSGVAPYLERAAPRLSQPVLFSIQWDDERFDRAGQLDLYDRLGSVDKRLHAYPGLHAENGPETFEFHAEFLKRYL